MKKITRMISIALVLTFTLLAFTACGPKPEDEAKKSVAAFFEALKKGDEKELKKNSISGENSEYLKDLIFNETSSDSDSKKMKELGKKIFEKTSYTIKSVKVENDKKVVVTTDITTIDFEVLFKKLIAAFFEKGLSNLTMSEDDQDKLLSDELKKIIDDKEVSTKTIKDVKITVEKIEGKWKVKLDSNMEKGILGNFNPKTLFK